MYVGYLTTPSNSLCQGSDILLVNISGLKETASIYAFVGAFSVTSWTPLLKLGLVTSSTSRALALIKSFISLLTFTSRSFSPC